MRLRTISRLIVIVLVIVVGLIIAIHQHNASDTPKPGVSGTGIINITPHAVSSLSISPTAARYPLVLVSLS